MSGSAHSDLDALRRSEPAPTSRGRGLGGRLAIIALVVLLLATAYAVLKPVIFPPRVVRVAPVVAVAVDGAAPINDGKAVQDVGWLEAYPFPTTVRPLVSGVLDELLVLEGQAVKRGETVIGRLRNLDIENAHDEAVADLAVTQARTKRAAATLAVAKSLLEQKLDPRRVEVETAVQLARRLGEIAALESEAERLEAVRQQAQVEVDAQKTLQAKGGGSTVAARRARFALLEAEMAIRVNASRLSTTRDEVDQWQRLGEIVSEGVKDPRALQGEVDLAEAALTTAKADEAKATVDRDVAKRNLDHLTVLAPRDGVVLRLESAPGAVVGPRGDYKEGDESGPGSTSKLNRMTGSIVSLYDPAELQLRVDVLFAQVAGVRIGAPVSFTIDAVPGKRFDGTVDRLVHEADINQNALQAKIRVKAPDPRMRPEMLCRVTFPNAPRKDLPAGTPTSGARHYRVPSEAVRDGAVFVYDPTGGGRARRVQVEVRSSADGSTIVSGALGISQRVILDPVEHDESVRIQDG